jgi:DNA-binding NarL/FixJ family response regulator
LDVNKRTIAPLIRIIIVDDHKLFRDLLRGYLENIVGFSISAEAENGSDALELVKKHRPHVCIMDITLKGLDGFEATRNIIQQCHKTRVLAISASTKPDYMRRMVEAGAKGYLSKDCPQETLCDAVRAVAAGLTYYQTGSRSLKDDMVNKRQRFSPRELQLVKLLCAGYKMSEIAAELKLSYNTIHSIKTNAIAKACVQSPSALIKYAVENGIA